MAQIELSQALGLPPVLRGTVSGARWEGVTPGSGMPPEARARNFEGLQAALDHAAASGKFFELEPGLYQIDGARGLAVPAGEHGFVWRGSRGAHIQQFADDAPILTVGDVTGRRMTAHADIRGLRLSYAADQSDNRGASALRLGLMRSSIVENVAVFADYGVSGPRIQAHRGIEVTNAAMASGFFSNALRDIFVGGARRHLLDIALVGTGSVFQNIYLTQGVTGRPALIEGEALRIAGNADLYESVFENLNVEWCIANVLILAQNCRATSFIGCHLEGNRLVGEDPRVMQVSTSQLVFHGLNILDLEVPTEGADGLAPKVFGFYGDCALSASGLQVTWSRPGKARRTFQLCGPGRYNPPDDRHRVCITDLTIRDVGGGNAHRVELDANLPVGVFPSPAGVERFVCRQDGLSRVEGAGFDVNADITVYGQLVDPRLVFPATLGAHRGVTLSDRMKPDGEGAAARPASGAMASVRRASGTADAFAVAIRNHDGRLLDSIAVAGRTARFQFDGKDWRSVD